MSTSRIKSEMKINRKRSHEWYLTHIPNYKKEILRNRPGLAISCRILRYKRQLEAKNQYQ